MSTAVDVHSVVVSAGVHYFVGVHVSCLDYTELPARTVARQACRRPSARYCCVTATNLAILVSHWFGLLAHSPMHQNLC